MPPLGMRREICNTIRAGLAWRFLRQEAAREGISTKGGQAFHRKLRPQNVADTVVDEGNDARKGRR